MKNSQVYNNNLPQLLLLLLQWLSTEKPWQKRSENATKTYWGTSTASLSEFAVRPQRGSCTAEVSSDSGKLVRWNDNTCMVLMLFNLLVDVFFLQRHVCCPWTQGLLTLELSSIVLEIPNDAYATLSQNLIGCSTLSQEYCKLIGWY